VKRETASSQEAKKGCKGGRGVKSGIQESTSGVKKKRETKWVGEITGKNRRKWGAPRGFA